jgi:EAL domain-containing protein (putative c-di-GMP-specific phosphodiesterase class I)
MKASAKISKCKENFLKIDMWNIKGLTTEKANDSHFQNIISKFNIIGLTPLVIEFFAKILIPPE